jgi:TP901-1 family phage major tail protein
MASGHSFKLKVYDGSSYNELGGQRETSLNRSVDEYDSTNKDTAQWHQGTPSIRNFTFSVSGVLEDESDTAWGDLEDAYEASADADRTVKIQIDTPAGNTYTGHANITSLNIDGPHDGDMEYSVELQGTYDSDDGGVVKA